MTDAIKMPWDKLMHSDQLKCIGTPGKRPLRLEPEPVRKRLKQVARSMALVHSNLKEVFRGLVTGQKRWPLLLHGPTGTGKTCAALALCDYVRYATYVTVEQLGHEVYNPDAYCWKAARQPIQRLYVVDELGIGHREEDRTMRDYSGLKRVCDYREQFARRVAIYISNVDERELLKRYDARIVDRIACGEVFHLHGPSRRR